MAPRARSTLEPARASRAFAGTAPSIALGWLPAPILLAPAVPTGCLGTFLFCAATMSGDDRTAAAMTTAAASAAGHITVTLTAPALAAAVSFSAARAISVQPAAAAAAAARFSCTHLPCALTATSSCIDIGTTTTVPAATVLAGDTPAPGASAAAMLAGAYTKSGLYTAASSAGARFTSAASASAPARTR